MEKTPTPQSDMEKPPDASRGRTAKHLAWRLHEGVLQSDSPEAALNAVNEVRELQEFRQATRPLPFASFYEAIENISLLDKLLDKLPLSEPEKGAQMQALVEQLETKSAKFSPRVADLYQALLAKEVNVKYEPKFVMTNSKMERLELQGDIPVLFSGEVSWDDKLNRIKTRFVDYLPIARANDIREGNEMDDDTRQWREEELQKMPGQPPEDEDESTPGVDPMSRRKEGEPMPAAIWTIENPGKGRYYKEKSFSVWNETEKKWTEIYVYSEAERVPLSAEEGPHTTLVAKLRAGKWIKVPMKYSEGLHDVDVDNRQWQVKRDQNGDLRLMVKGDGGEILRVRVMLAPHPNPENKLRSNDPNSITVPKMESVFSQETDQKLEQVEKEKRGHIARARELAKYTRSRIQYLAPKDREEADRFNALYRTHPNGFAGGVDECKKADCDVGNTYFSALCARLNIPTRHVVGHSVGSKQKSTGNAFINGTTGHAWTEVWDEIGKIWVKIDATSAGDPNLQEEDSDNDIESIQDDDDGQEALIPSDADIEKLRQKLAEHAEKLSYTKEERQLAEGAGIELREARQIVKEINEAERTRLPNGKLVMNELAKLFSFIIQTRKSQTSGYTGPVRADEGGEEIENIVSHFIQAASGDTDPRSRRLPILENKEDKLVSGFDVYLIGDKSGSMDNSVDGELLWKMQRRSMYLILSALHSFENNLKKAGLNKDNKLSVRTQCISFRGDGDDQLDEDKKLSSDFTAQDQVNMWHSVSNQGGGNGDVTALATVSAQIHREIEENNRKNLKDNRLRIVIACSDGGYMGNDAASMRVLAEELSKQGVIVVGMGLTATARSVEVVMNNPPYSFGDIVENIDDLPLKVAKHVVLQAIKLFPQKARQDAYEILTKTIAQFEK